MVTFVFIQCLKQFETGDPISPFLFILVVEALGTLITKGKDLVMVKGLDAGQDGEEVTHLQFADDMILFSSTKWEELAMLKRILRCFQL